MASRLRGIGIITDRGSQIGRLRDMVVDESDGRILSLVVRPISRNVLAGIQRGRDGNIAIPFSAVMAVRDYIVVDERALAVQYIKKEATGAESMP